MDLVACSSILGTFARVWLARLAGCVAEKKDKVFALKVMRKSDSKSTTRDIVPAAGLIHVCSHQVEANRTHPQRA